MYVDVLGLDYINENRPIQSSPYELCENLPKDLNSAKNIFRCTGDIRDCETQTLKYITFGPTSILNYSPRGEKNTKKCICFCDDFKNPKTIRNISLQEVCAKNDQGYVESNKGLKNQQKTL